MSGVDISREACDRLASWHKLEARALRMHNPNSPAMPEIAEVQDETAAMILALRAALDEAERAQDDFQASFDLRWKADMRAIKRWQEKHPKRDKVWPAHADLVVWLPEGWEECSVELLKCIHERDAAHAMGYARGVRDAAEAYKHGIGAILALLPATNEKRLTRYMGQIMAECDCPRQDECQTAERCLAEKETGDLSVYVKEIKDCPDYRCRERGECVNTTYGGCRDKDACEEFAKRKETNNAE